MKHVRITYPHVEARACREMWCAVLLSVLRDLCDAGARSTERVAAERWVGTWPGRDFRIICHLAGVDPDWLHGALSDLVSMPVANRRQRLAARLGCQPGQIGTCLTVRQQALKESEGEVHETARKTRSVPISPAARRARVATMFGQGVRPSDMPRALKATGHAVSMSMIWNDLQSLRASGRIGYAQGRANAPGSGRATRPILHMGEEP